MIGSSGCREHENDHAASMADGDYKLMKKGSVLMELAITKALVT
jgi:hypothetical protein